jgi:hypothetical protein
VARRLKDAGIPVAMTKEEDPSGRAAHFQVLVPVGWEARAREILAVDWERETEAQGLDPVTQGKAMALDAQGLCPACGDALLPEAAQCASCGIALA